MNSGRLVQLNVSRGGVPKHAVPAARVFFDRLEGDDWNDKRFHGRPGQAVCLYALELIEELNREGFPLFPGALGENFTTSGLDYRKIQPGQLYRVGEDVILRITKVRTPCRTIAVYGSGILRALYDADVKAGKTDSPRWGRSGFYAAVVAEGTVRPGDPLFLLPDREGARSHFQA
jgi:MOSC domain-containing protein YiiM